MNYNYKYLKKISEGAFSKCDLYLKKSNYYAIKTLVDINSLEGLTCNELREICSLLKLKEHPNIIQLHDIFLDTKLKVNLVYKYYPETLNNFIKITDVSYREKLIIPFITQMLSILHYIHINDIIHTDIKLSNILINETNNNQNDLKINIKMIDFGSCQIEGLTDKYSIVSTYTIRAPEIYSYDMTYDNKIDIWSFGVILYEFITGNAIIDYKKHYKSNDIDKINDIYIYVSKINNINISSNLKLFLKSILKTNPEDRLNINDLINLYNEIFKTKIILYENKEFSDITSNFSFRKQNNIENKNFIEINNINKYISDRIFNVKLLNLTFSYIILNKLDYLNKLDNLNNYDYITIWYLNYQLTHSDIEYILIDFIPVFNSYYKTIFNLTEIHKNCYNILNIIDFDLI